MRVQAEGLSLASLCLFKPAGLLTTNVHPETLVVLFAPVRVRWCSSGIGGKTRGPAGPKSEGESYFFVADHFDWWGKPDLRSRASTEDFARDSFENVLFSICRCVRQGPACLKFLRSARTGQDIATLYLLAYWMVLCGSGRGDVPGTIFPVSRK